MKQIMKASILKMLLESIPSQADKSLVGLHNVDVKIYKALLQQLYLKLHTELTLYKDSKIQIPRSEALALWLMYQDAAASPQHMFLNPSVEAMFSQLHQKLS
jgi:hypothetical protein